jgi:hypothetical protein
MSEDHDGAASMRVAVAVNKLAEAPDDRRPA